MAVCDRDEAKARAAGEKFGAQWFTDATQMLDTVKLDLVDITTRMDTHRELAALTAARKIPTVVQKPFAPEWEECVAIVENAKAHGAWLAVHENFRFASAMMRVSEVIAAGTIGEPSWARIYFRTGYDVYKGQPYFYNEERLAILDVGIHVLDLARVFLGEVERVSCETQRRNPKVRAEDTATMMLRHTSGAVSVIECTYEARRSDDAFPETLLEIEGSRRLDHHEEGRGDGRHHARPVLRGARRHAAAVVDDEAVACIAGGRAQHLQAHARCACAPACPPIHRARTISRPMRWSRLPINQRAPMPRFVPRLDDKHSHTFHRTNPPWTTFPFTAADLEVLKQWDTPTICNGLELIVPERRAVGFTVEPMVAVDRKFPPIVGLARTGLVRAKEPPRGAIPAREDWYDYVSPTGLPTIAVIQDIDDRPGFGAFWGEVQTTIHKALGVAGCVTNGSFRDLDMLAPGFQIIGGRIGPSHAHIHMVQMNCDANIFGMLVRMTM